MKIRIASAILWLFVGWYAGAYLAEIFAVSTVLGPLLGVATAGILVGDPLRLVWSKPSANDAARSMDTLAKAA